MANVPDSSQPITGADVRTPPLTAAAYARLLMYPDSCRHEAALLLVEADSHGACYVPAALTNEVLRLCHEAGYTALFVARDWQHNMVRLAAWKRDDQR